MPRLVTQSEAADRPGPEAVFLAVASYLPVLCMLPALSRNDSSFARDHGRQGIVLFVAELLACMLAFVPRIGPLLAAGSLLVLGAVALKAMREAVSGRFWRIPVAAPVAEYLHNLAP